MIFEKSTAYLIALNLSKELWDWLRSNPTKKVKDWKYYEKYKDKLAVADCAICTARCEFKKEFSEYITTCDFYEGTQGNMDECVFLEFCENYPAFRNGETVEERKAYAEQACLLLQNEIANFKNKKGVKNEND